MERGVRAPDATQRMRLIEDAEDEMAWSDEARTQIGVQVTAVNPRRGRYS